LRFWRYAAVMKSENGTLGECLDNGYGIAATCTACWHSAGLDIAVLAAKLGRDHGALRDDLVPKLRCTKCGGKHIGLTAVAPDTPKIWTRG